MCWFPGNAIFSSRIQAQLGTMRGVTTRRLPICGNKTARSRLIPNARAV